MTRWGLWFCGGPEGHADWLRNKHGEVMSFQNKHTAEKWREILISSEESIEVRRFTDGRQPEGKAEGTESKGD